MKIIEAYALLRKIENPLSDNDIVAAGYIKGVSISHGEVKVVFLFPEEMRDNHKPVIEKARQLFQEAGAERVDFQVNFVLPSGQSKKETPNVKAKTPKRKVQGVKHVVLVTSGKGGVGKSTVSANLAVALAQSGHAAGLFDADVYGPSIPTLMGIKEAGVTAKDNKIQPIPAYTVKVMSLGLMLEDDSPVIWRGPLVHKAYEQLLFDTDWGDLDFLILDLPPGTGDAQLAMAQLVEIAGGIVVTTPQALSVNDVRRAVSMLRKVEINPLGLVESMSYYKCPECGHIEHIFGQGGGEKLAREMGLALLAQIPLDPDLVAGSDAGIPVVMSKPDSEASKAFFKLAEEVVSRLEGKSP